MATQVPSPFESTNEESSFFNELIAETGPTSRPSASFPSTGFSTDKMLGMFRNETNIMLASEVSKMRANERNVFGQRLFGWKERLESAIGKIEEKIHVLADVKTPQQREARQKVDDELRRPIAYALLKAIKADLVRQTKQLEQVEQKLVTKQISEMHEKAFKNAVSTKDRELLKHNLYALFRNIFKSVHKSYGAKGFGALFPFIQKMLKAFPDTHKALFLEQFVKTFQDAENVTVGLLPKKAADIAALLHLHSNVHDVFASNDKGVMLSFFDKTNIELSYIRGPALAEKTPLPHGALSKQLIALSLALLVDNKKLMLQQSFQEHVPELSDVIFTFDNVAKKITLHDLLHMKSGLIDVDALAALLGKNPKNMPLEQKLLLLKEHPQLVFDPAQEGQESITNNLLLIKIIEKASKMPFQDFVQKYILSKGALNMPGTKFVNDVELTTTFLDFIKLGQNVMKNKLGKNPEKIAAMLLDEGLYGGVSVFSQEGGKALVQASRMSGLSLLFLASLLQNKKERAFFMATNNESAIVHPFVQKLVNDPLLQPLFGLAFVPFITQEETLEQESEPIEEEALVKLMKKFEGLYRSDALMLTWQVTCKKQKLDHDQKEHVGLEIATPEIHFFVPTYADEKRAHMVLAGRPICRLELSDNTLLLQDPSCGMRDVLFEKVR